jgi:hypothetical protein
MAATEPPLTLLGPDTLQLLLTRATTAPLGAFLEVGVYRGGSAWHLAKLAQAQNRLCFLADTFRGIPYQGPRDSHKIGDFSETSLEAVRAAIPYPALYIPGVFPESMCEWFDATCTKFGFVHLDCDQEQSYRTALAWIWPRLVEGGIVWCDDADCIPGAGYAVEEFVRGTPSAGILRAGKWQLEKHA